VRRARRKVSGWCAADGGPQAVCSLYGVAVSDFTSSFADGRVVCLLVSVLIAGQHKRQLIFRHSALA